MRSLIGLLLACLLAPSLPGQSRDTVRKTTVAGSMFEVHPRFERAIAEQIESARKTLRTQRQAGKWIAYVSTPISSRGGGHEPTNLAISAFVKKQLEQRYDGLWALDPGQFQLPSVDGKEPQGGEYLYMWTEILAGPDGKGSDFDLVYFTGPTDMASFFGSSRLGDRLGDLLEAIDRSIEKQAAKDEAFRKEVAADTARRAAFRRFYALRASVAWSKGAHDEWNLFVRVNKKRGVGEQIAMHFDGRALSPAEMETEITPGYELPRPANAGTAPANPR